MPKADKNKETPKEYFDRYYQKFNDGEIHEFDMVPVFSKNHCCLSCGNPKMQDAVSGSECRVCAVKRIGQEEYDRRMQLKSESLAVHEERIAKKHGKQLAVYLEENINSASNF